MNVALFEGGLAWVLYGGTQTDALGFLPSFLRLDDPRPAREQIAERYISGWSPVSRFRLNEADELCYPGDPPLPPLAMTFLRGEKIRFYPHEWLAIQQPDGALEVSRVD